MSSRLLAADTAAVNLRQIKAAAAAVDAEFQVYLRMARGAATIEQLVNVAITLVEKVRVLEEAASGTLVDFGCEEDPFPPVITIPEEHINESE